MEKKLVKDYSMSETGDTERGDKSVVDNRVDKLDKRESNCNSPSVGRKRKQNGTICGGEDSNDAASTSGWYLTLLSSISLFRQYLPSVLSLPSVSSHKIVNMSSG